MYCAARAFRPLGCAAASLPQRISAGTPCLIGNLRCTQKRLFVSERLSMRRFSSSDFSGERASAPVPVATSAFPAPAVTSAEALAPVDAGPTLAGLTSIIDKDDGVSVITSHDKYGFTVNNIHMRGSVIVFRNYTLLWNVTRVIDISPRNLAIAHMVRPRPELLLVGTGETADNINPALYAYMARRGISIEALSTVRHICSTRRSRRRKCCSSSSGLCMAPTCSLCRLA